MKNIKILFLMIDMFNDMNTIFRTIQQKGTKLDLIDLPYNCIFNKKITGCGGTTIVTYNSEDYVIAVPSKELIINKTGLDEPGISVTQSYNGTEIEVIGLFNTFSYDLKKLVKEYSKKSGPKKIFCTYDKINALASILDLKQWRLLVDEYQVLLKAYSYRDKAINGIIQNFKKFKSYCFMSATPIPSDFKPDFLKQIPEYEVEWSKLDKTTVELIETNKPYITASNIINRFLSEGMTLDNEKVEELFFFLNSVRGISAIINHCKLNPNLVKIVCADTDANKEKLAGYNITNSRSPNKPITFITSKSFEGADYFSDRGVCFVISNSGESQTQADIATDIYQIAGRIRTETNPFRNKIYHIYNTTGSLKLNLNLTYEDMKKLVKEEEDGANAILKVINSNENAKKIASKMINEAYIILEGDKYVLNDSLIKLELFNYNINQQIYKNGISLASNYQSNGIEVTNTTKIIETDKLNKKISFKEAFLNYCDNPNGVCIVQPLVVDAYKILGPEKVKKLRYVKTKIKEAIAENSADEVKITKNLKSKIKIGFISNAKLKEIFKDIYLKIHYTKEKPIASHIERYYKCKKVSKKINSQSVRGYEIYSPTFNIL